MLWLTRVYGGSVNGYAKAFLAWPNVLDHWLRRCSEDRFRNERALRRGPDATYAPGILGRRTSTARRNPRLEALQLADWNRARAAGQGGR